MQHFIVIPLYDHTSEQEVDELLDDLGRLGLAIDPYHGAATRRATSTGHTASQSVTSSATAMHATA
jgi:hypothetical protein